MTLLPKYFFTAENAESAEKERKKENLCGLRALSG